MHEIVQGCAGANSSINSMLHRTNETLSDLIDEQIEKIKFNSNIHSEGSIDGIIKSAEKSMDYYKLIDEKILKDSLNLIEGKVMNTANHLGGICSPQSFQGDLLYCNMLERMGISTEIVPISATALIPMCNCTHPRGAVLYSVADSPHLLYFVPGREKNSVVKLAEPMDMNRVISKIGKFEKSFSQTIYCEKISKELKEIYCNPSVYHFDSFSEQAGILQYQVSNRLFPKKGPKLAYFEMEKFTLDLAIEDLKNKNSILHNVIYDEKIRNEICKTDMDTGTSFSRLLFKGIDHKKRLFSIDYTSEGKLVGRNRNNEEVSYKSDEATLIYLFENNIIAPGIGMILIVLFFSRGLTWMGGIFQSEYLPEMQKMLSNAFNKAGYYDLGRYISGWKCDGYISGPIFMLSETESGTLVNAGPFECIINNINWDEIQELIFTKIRDAHFMGMFEFYNDLFPASKRIDGWYGKIADYCKEHYQKNKI